MTTPLQSAPCAPSRPPVKPAHDGALGASSHAGHEACEARASALVDADGLLSEQEGRALLGDGGIDRGRVLSVITGYRRIAALGVGWILKRQERS